MTAPEAYEAFDAKWPKLRAWFTFVAFDQAHESVQLDGVFTIEQLKEIVRLAEAIEREL